MAWFKRKKIESLSVASLKEAIAADERMRLQERYEAYEAKRLAAERARIERLCDQAWDGVKYADPPQPPPYYYPAIDAAYRATLMELAPK